MHLGLLGDPVVCVHALNSYVADVNAWNAGVLEKQSFPYTKDQEGKDLLFCLYVSSELNLTQVCALSH